MLRVTLMSMSKPRQMTLEEILNIINRGGHPPLYDNVIMLHMEPPAPMILRKLRTQYQTPWTLDMLRDVTAVVRISERVSWRPLTAFCIVRDDASNTYTVTRRMLNASNRRFIEHADRYKVFVQGLLDVCGYMEARRGGAEYTMQVSIPDGNADPLVSALRSFKFTMLNGTVYHLHVDQFSAQTPNSDVTPPYETTTADDTSMD